MWLCGLVSHSAPSPRLSLHASSLGLQLGLHSGCQCQLRSSVAACAGHQLLCHSHPERREGVRAVCEVAVEGEPVRSMSAIGAA